MLDFTALHWVVVIVAAAMIGFSKTGMPGAGILVVPILAAVMDPQLSVGFLLPILCVADVTAVAYWRRHADWSKLIWLFPWAFVGILLGYLGHKFVFSSENGAALEIVIGGIVLVMIGITVWRNSRSGKTAHIPTHWSFAAVMGVLAGTTTMLANAAGPIMTIYLLAMRFDKERFIGTGAWYFFIMNLVKIPFMINAGMITTASALTNVALIPAILAGGILGILLVHRIPERQFNIAVTVLAVLAAAILLLKNLF